MTLTQHIDKTMNEKLCFQESGESSITLVLSLEEPVRDVKNHYLRRKVSFYILLRSNLFPYDNLRTSN